MDKKIKLKPCPFCGAKKIKVGTFSIVPDGFVECKKCGVRFDFRVDWGNMPQEEHDKQILIKAGKLWNRRN